MSRWLCAALISLPAVSWSACVTPANDPFANTQLRPQTGSVTVHSLSLDGGLFGAPTATAYLTDNCSNDLVNVFDYPKVQTMGNDAQIGPEFYSSKFTIPASVQIKGTGADPKFADVVDYRITVDTPLRPHASLSVESVFFDPVSTQYGIANVFGTIAGLVGVTGSAGIPFMVGDTSGDGRLTDADTLYSLADLRQFLTAPPNFALGGSFAAVNGIVSLFPGMLFSTTPFVFTAAGGFSGTPFTGTVTVAGDTVATAVPEPNTAAILGFAILAYRRCTRRGRMRRSLKES